MDDTIYYRACIILVHRFAGEYYVPLSGQKRQKCSCTMYHFRPPLHELGTVPEYPCDFVNVAVAVLLTLLSAFKQPVRTGGGKEVVSQLFDYAPIASLHV